MYEYMFVEHLILNIGGHERLEKIVIGNNFEVICKLEDVNGMSEFLGELEKNKLDLDL